MTEKDKGGRPRIMKGGRVCSFMLDTATVAAIDKRAKELKRAGGSGSKSEAVRDLIGKPGK